MTLEKLNRLNFAIFVLLLPFCALGYFYEFFSSWAANASLYPLLIGLMLMSAKFLMRGKIFTNKNLNYLLIFSIVALIGTFLMPLIIAEFGYISNGSLKEEIYVGTIKKIATFSIIFLTVYYTALCTINTNHKFIIKTLYISFILVLLYGYIQIFAILFPFSLWYQIYISIQQYINFGWIGLNEGWNKIPQIYNIGGRIILTTQEPSVAGYLLTTLYYPFILSSLVTNYSIYKIKLFGKPIEFIFFIFSLPILFFTFSTSAYVVFLILILFGGYLYYKKLSFKKLTKFSSYFIIFCIILSILYKSLPQDYIKNIIFAFEKILMSGQGGGSAQTRYGFMYAGFVEFLHYPLFGVGVGNSKYVFANYIPTWAYNSEVIYYLSTGKALGPKGFWSWLLGETGILGTLTFILFLYSLIKKYLSKVDFTFKDKKVIYLKYAFFIFLISFFLQGFNSAALSFIWQWALFGFFVGFIYPVKRRSNMKLYLDGLFYKGSGIGRYYESLTKEFAKRGIKIYTCVPKNLRDDFEKDFKDKLYNIEPTFVKYEKLEEMRSR